jgi:GxxExxY protein
METQSNGATEKILFKHRGTEDTGGKDPITGEIISAAIEVHKSLGPGLLESVYETCLCHELKLRGITFERQKVLPVRYKGVSLDTGLRIDLLVADQVVVELKCVEKLAAIHDAQVLTYMRLSGVHTGLLLNFFTSKMMDGVKRMVL